MFVAFQSFGLANGGVESISSILDAVAHWPRTVVTQTETRFTERWRKMGCDVHVWPIAPHEQLEGHRWLRGRVVRATEVAAYNARIAALCRHRGVRVVHANDIGAFWHAGPGAKLAGARVVFNVRSIFPDDVPYGPKWSLVHHLADEVVCLSEEMREVVLSRFPPTFGHRVPSGKTSVIYTGIDLERFSPPSPERRAELRARFAIPPDAFAVGHMARVWDIKNQLPFLREAMPRLMQANPRVHLYFVGDIEETGRYASECRAVVAATPYSDRVHWVGFVSDPTPWFQALDATVLVSRYEGLARAMIESAACGVPTVSFDLTSAREVLDVKGAGITVPRGDYVGIAAALAELASNAARCSALGARARAVAIENFDEVRTAAAYRALYERLANRPSSPAGDERRSRA